MLRDGRWLLLFGLIAVAAGCSLDRSGSTPDDDERDAGEPPRDGTVTPPDLAVPDVASPDAGPPIDASGPDAGDAATPPPPPDAALDATIVDATFDASDVGPTDLGTPDLGPMDAGPMDAGPPDTGPVDAGPPPDLGPGDACGRVAPPSTVFLADDGAELRGGYLSYVSVEDPAQLELVRDSYRYGGLLGVGYGAALVDEDYSFAEVAAAAGTQRGARLITTFDAAFSGGTPAPPFLDLPADGYTLELRGEIHLAPGTWTFELDVDDRGMLQVTVDGVALDVRNFHSDPISIGTIVVRSDGWYPFHFAYSDVGGNSGYRIRAARDGSGLAVLTPAMMRFDARNLPGREMHGFDAIMPTGLPDGSRYDGEPTDVNWARGSPTQVGIGSADDWSVRWAGRLLFVTSDASLIVSSDDVQRVWIDGLVYGGAYDGLPTTTSYETHVPAGWHDVILEMTERSGDAFFSARLAGVRFDTPGMRLATRFGGHVATRLVSGLRTFAAGSMAHTDLDIDEPRAGLVAAEISVQFDATTTLEGVSVVVGAPGGGTRTWAAPASAVRLGIGRWGFRAVWTGAGLPADADGRWTVDVSGTGTTTGSVTTAGLVAHSGGVPLPFAPVGTWESVPIDLGGLSQLSMVSAGFDARFGMRVQTEVRWGNDVPSLGTARWTAVGPGGAVPGAPVALLAQVRVVLMGDGTDTPRVWSVGLDSSRCIP